MQESISYLKSYGIEKKQGNLLYKLLPTGYYLVAYINNDIDLFLCNLLPESHEHTSDEGCVKFQKLCFKIDKTYKQKKFKEMLVEKKKTHP